MTPRFCAPPSGGFARFSRRASFFSRFHAGRIPRRFSGFLPFVLPVGAGAAGICRQHGFSGIGKLAGLPVAGDLAAVTSPCASPAPAQARYAASGGAGFKRHAGAMPVPMAIPMSIPILGELIGVKIAFFTLFSFFDGIWKYYYRFISIF